MTSAELLLIVQGIEAAIAAAPEIVDLIEKAKAFITSLSDAGLITKATQDALHAHVDARCAAAAGDLFSGGFCGEPAGFAAANHRGHPASRMQDDPGRHVEIKQVVVSA